MLKISLVLFFCILICKGEYKKCDPHNLQELICPDNARCEEKSQNNGQCICNPDYSFNEIYKNNSDYCLKYVKKPEFTNSTHLPINQIKPPGTHHLIGGILIPILMVFILLALIFGIKKYGLIQKLRNLFIRRQRRRYEDVVMGNDLDDPPLI